MICQLCSYEFDETQVSACSSCALNKHCAIICCPQCGYQSVDESKSTLTQNFRRLFMRSKQKPTQTILQTQTQCRRLSDLQPGQSATIVGIESANVNRQERLHVFGVLPGNSITLEQRYPALVISIGFTQLSIESELASEILIE